MKIFLYYIFLISNKEREGFQMKQKYKYARKNKNEENLLIKAAAELREHLENLIEFIPVIIPINEEDKKLLHIEMDAFEEACNDLEQVECGDIDQIDRMFDRNKLIEAYEFIHNSDQDIVPVDPDSPIVRSRIEDIIDYYTFSADEED